MTNNLYRARLLFLLGISSCLSQNLGPIQQGVASFYGGPQVRIRNPWIHKSNHDFITLWQSWVPTRAVRADLRSKLPQDNTSPNVASFGLLSGSCGYGLLQQNQWPYWQATAISAGNIVYSSGNPKGCGACIQATCTSVRLYFPFFELHLMLWIALLWKCHQQLCLNFR